MNNGQTLTDAGNARRFVKQHGEDLRYCWAWRSWLVWDGKRWQRDLGDGVMTRAKKTAKSIYQEAADETDVSRRGELAVWARKSESEPSLRRMLVLAQSEPCIAVAPDQLDAHHYLLNTPSGTLELLAEGGPELREHRRCDLLTKLTAAPFVPGAVHPVFETFRERLLTPELDDYLAQVGGTCLAGDTRDEKLFFCYGPTAGGKTTLTKALATALGSYAITADFTTFLEQKHSGPRNDLARLAGARMVLSVEVSDGTKLAEGLLKQLTGGDMVSARFLYAEHFEFTPQFKLWLVANDRPRARASDGAFWRRMAVVPFDVSLPEEERDPEVKRVLCDPQDAGPAILGWAAKGLAKWVTAGKRLIDPEAVKRASADYRGAMDVLADFLADKCTLASGAMVSSKRLRESYETWAREAGVHPVNGTAFARLLEARGCRRTRQHGGVRWWLGLRELDSDSAEPHSTTEEAET